MTVDPLVTQSCYPVRFEWGLAGVTAGSDPEGVTILVDILSFTTAVDAACARGVVVYPWADRGDGAADLARSVGALLAGPRRTGGPSLSPASLSGLPSGSRIVLPSPNGAALSLACRAGILYAGCLRNASAVARAAAAHGLGVTVVAAGERWPDGSPRFAVEDLWGAGAVVTGLPGERSPEAQMAADAYEAVRPRLAEALADCVSGRELGQMGYPQDIGWASEAEVSCCVPRFRDGAYRNQG